MILYNCFPYSYIILKAVQKKHVISFFQLGPLQKIWKLSKSRLDQKLCQFLFFSIWRVFDKLSKFGQISCVIPCYIEIKDSLFCTSNGIRTHNHLVRKQTLNNGWVFVYELSGCGFESRCCHLSFRYHACFKQRVPWHSSNFRV